MASCTDKLFEQIQQQKTIAGIIDKIRSSNDLHTILNTTATEIRQLLNADRVCVFRFLPESGCEEGEFVAEDITEGISSALAERVYDRCFGSQFTADYAQGRIQAIADIDEANLSDCYMSILKRFQVRANLIVPVLKDGELWGLLCVHQCHQPRRWQLPEIEFVRKIADYFAIALQQAEQLEQITNQATLLAKTKAQSRALKRQKALVKITNRIRQSLDWTVICQTATKETLDIIDADRVTIYQFNEDWSGKFLFESHKEGWQSLTETLINIRDTHFMATKGGCYKNNTVLAINDIYQARYTECYIKLLEQLQAKAYVVAPIFEKDHLWGMLAVYQNSGPRQWQTDEIELLTQIGEQLSIALRQSLEQERAINRQKSLIKIVSKIRRSFDFQDICQTATDEVRSILNADRVAIYQFNSDWSGQFLFESVAEQWQPLVNNIPPVEDTFLMENQGGRYRRNETFSVDDIYTVGHQDCHIKLLEEFQAKAYAIAPIFENNRLWGLLAAYQNTGPRPWKNDEVELLAQIGEQLGIAIQQSLEQERAINRQKSLIKIVSKIRRSFDFQDICQTATDEVRSILNADRVAIYQFNSDWSGQFLFESVAEQWQPLVNNIPPVEDTFLMENQGGRYRRNETFSVDDIYTVGHQDCHIKLLEEFQAKAYAIAPIFDDDKLWGLLAAYQNNAPRSWQADEIDLLAQVGEQLGIALQQADYVQYIQNQAEQLKNTLDNLKESQAQLIQTEKMASLGQLVAGVAHEINNPVNFIYGNLSHLNGHVHDLFNFLKVYEAVYPEPEATVAQAIDEYDIDFIKQDFPKIVDSISLGTERIREIVTSLRNFSRIDEAAFKAVDIHEGLDSTLLILQHRLKDTGSSPAIELIQDYGSLPLVTCFPSQLNQVFMNLLANAIDAIEESNKGLSYQEIKEKQPCITIRTQQLDDHAVAIMFQDNGTGMSEGTCQRIFDPFFTTKAVGKGTGMGLSISYQIVTEKHRGSLKCISGKGQGTTFTIRLPITQEDTLHE
ncbi:hypothetical protein NIES208_07920 [[Limnothrix rosea] IAM M-220]|nr:hypothetical protein NIES208_07920 [[Limnothrix rosea] IAM M-220]